MTAGVACKFTVHFSTLFSTTNFCAEIPISVHGSRLCCLSGLPRTLSRLCSLDQPSRSFKAYDVSIEEPQLLRWALSCLVGKKQSIMTHITNKAATMLPTAPEPPLSYPGATPDSDRAKKPPLAEPSATGGELNPGDRVEGLGNFGVPTGELGTVEQTNEEDAVVKWDDDGRMRIRQPWLKKA
jgi:hypothetical protein